MTDTFRFEKFNKFIFSSYERCNTFICVLFLFLIIYLHEPCNYVGAPSLCVGILK